jgi:hypothetical protein
MMSSPSIRKILIIFSLLRRRAVDRPRARHIGPKNGPGAAFFKPPP